MFKHTREVYLRHQKTEMLRLLEDYMRSVADGEARAELKKAYDELFRQSAGSDKDILDLNDCLLDWLKKMRAEIKENNLLTLQMYVAKFRSLLVDRSELCPVHSSLPMTRQDEKQLKRMEKLRKKRAKERKKRVERGENVPVAAFSSEELVDCLLKKCLDEKARLMDHMASIHARLLKNKNDAYAANDWKSSNLKLRAVDADIESYSNEKLRVVAVSAMERISSTYKELLISREISNDDLNKIRNETGRLMKERAADAGIVNSLVNDVMDGNACREIGQQPEYVRNNVKNDAYDQAFASLGAIAAGGNADILESELFKQFGAAPTEAELKLKAIRENAAAEIAGIENKIFDIDRQLQDFQAEGKRRFEKCARLLMRLDETAGAERIILQGDIDAADSEYDSFVNNIKVLSNIKANLLERRKFFESVKTGQLAEEYLGDIGKLDIDSLNEMALEIRKQIEALNGDLETLGTLNMVIDSGKIQTDTISTKSSNLDKAAGKNEDKYKALKRKYGLGG